MPGAMEEPEIQMPISVRIIQNPWSHSVTNEQLATILWSAAHEVAERIKRRHRLGIYKVPKLAVCIMDPTAPMSRPSEEAIMAIILIGEGAQENLWNAISKAFEHRDHGANIGALARAHSHRLPDGAFRYGHSVDVDGTIGGTSGLTQVQDRAEGTMLIADVNLGVQDARKEWEETVGDPADNYWYCNQGKPQDRVMLSSALQGLWDQTNPAHMFTVAY